MQDDQFEQREKVEIAMLRAEHQKKYQMMIEFIKDRIGTGIEYSNSVSRMVISEAGGFCELVDLPEEFCGAAGPSVLHSFISAEGANNLMADAEKIVQSLLVDSKNVRQFEIVALYNRRGLVDRKSCYIVNYTAEDMRDTRTNVIGSYRPGVLPIYFKIKVDAIAGSPHLIMGSEHCIVAFIKTSGELFPLLNIKYDANRTTDLTAKKIKKTIQ